VSATAIGYDSHGGLETETFGNGLIHTVVYNNRLQPTQIRLGTAAAPSSVLGLTYNYGTTANNGNVLSVAYAGGGLSYTQTFGYDALNRLTTSQETAGGVTSWSQTNGHDRYGNRWVVLAGGAQSLSFSATTNRITGWGYDAAGNLTSDAAANYSYDAENRLRAVNAAPGYVYDGEGRRVKKTLGEATRFAYGVGGQLLAEYDAATGALRKQNAYGPGGLLASVVPNALAGAGTRYVTADHLGSPRAVTGAGGAVVSRHDYKPFGEELGAGIGGRTAAQGYGQADGVRQGFTGYEKDGETGLNFAQARYHSPRQGRFTSPDQPLVDQWQNNPQSWNLYAYVRNNPLNSVDPFGMAAECPRGWEGCVERDGKFYWPHPETGEEIEIVTEVIRVDSDDSGVPSEDGTRNLTVGEALQQQEERRNNFILNNVVAGIGYGIGKIFSGLGSLFRAGSKATPSATPGLPKSAPKPLGRGSTGRTTPSNLTEQLAMEQAMSNPGAGRQVPLSQGMTDLRWPASDGWVKMSQNVNGVEIHYVRNTSTGAVDDFKFIDRK
jgi:RHS repeat-associated protein